MPTYIYELSTLRVELFFLTVFFFFFFTCMVLCRYTCSRVCIFYAHIGISFLTYWLMYRRRSRVVFATKTGSAIAHAGFCVYTIYRCCTAATMNILTIYKKKKKHTMRTMITSNDTCVERIALICVLWI